MKDQEFKALCDNEEASILFYRTIGWYSERIIEGMVHGKRGRRGDPLAKGIERRIEQFSRDFKDVFKLFQMINDPHKELDERSQELDDFWHYAASNMVHRMPDVVLYKLHREPQEAIWLVDNTIKYLGVIEREDLANKHLVSPFEFANEHYHLLRDEKFLEKFPGIGFYIWGAHPWNIEGNPILGDGPNHFLHLLDKGDKGAIKYRSN